MGSHSSLRCLVLLLGIAIANGNDWPIKNVVVLMLENRSFDHVLGYLKQINPQIDGLTGNEFNLFDPRNASSPKVKVSFDSPYDIGLNPGHSLEATEQELWGSYNPVTPAPMDGFVYNAVNSYSASIGPHVMRCFNSTSLPAISNLALDFAVFDQWHSSVPGPTFPNRLFFLSGTSQGTVSNIVDDEIVGFDQRTIFDDIYDSGLNFNIYYSDFPTCLILRKLRDYPDHVRILDDFFADAAEGNLPEFSWVEPRWFDFWEWQENDQHPPHNMAQGEFLIKEVYEALRNSPQWNETLLIITYDEHGGLYDHVSPPTVGIPNPDGINSTKPPFGFDRLGVRVPMVMVSPWIESGTVLGEPAVHHYDHTSFAATFRKMFQLEQPPLTKREAWAATWEKVINRKSPRTDCPKNIPIPENQKSLWDSYRKSQSIKETASSIAKMRLRNPHHVEMSPVMSDLQQEIVSIAKMVDGDGKGRENAETVYEGATFVREMMQRYMQAHPKKQSPL